MKVTDLRSLARQLGMRGYSKLRKDDLIDFINNNLSSRPPPRPAPRPTGPHEWRPPPRSASRPAGPCEQRPPPRPVPRPAGPCEWRPPPRPAPRLTQPRQPSIRFMPDRLRQPELLRKLEERNPQPPPLASPVAWPTLKPYLLKPKRDTNVEPFLEPPIVEPPVEQPPPDPKKLKRMKKK